MTFVLVLLFKYGVSWGGVPGAGGGWGQARPRWCPCASQLNYARPCRHRPPQYVRVIYAYMGLAGFSIFFVLTGIIALELLQKWGVHTDFISFTYIL